MKMEMILLPSLNYSSNLGLVLLVVVLTEKFLWVAEADEISQKPAETQRRTNLMLECADRHDLKEEAQRNSR